MAPKRWWDAKHLPGWQARIAAPDNASALAAFFTRQFQMLELKLAERGGK
jgi:hypothetical protein